MTATVIAHLAPVAEDSVVATGFRRALWCSDADAGRACIIARAWIIIVAGGVVVNVGAAAATARIGGARVAVIALLVRGARAIRFFVAELLKGG